MASNDLHFTPSYVVAKRRLGLLLLVLGVLGAGAGFALSAVTPSEPVPATTTADVRKADNPEALRHPYLSFDCKRVISTRVVKSGRGHRNRPWTAYYYLLPIEDRYLVATSDKPVTAGLIQGKIVKWDMPVNVSALGQVYRKMPGYSERILPVQLDIGDYADPPAITGWALAYVMGGVVGCVVAVMGLWKFATSFVASARVVPQQEAEWSYTPPGRWGAR